MEYNKKTRWVYSFYLCETSFEEEINKLHFKLMKKYFPLVDEIVFCIVTELDKSHSLVRQLKDKILDIYNGIITFKIYPNTGNRESLVFKKEIVDKMDNLDGYTMFGHNKGVGDVKDKDASMERVMKWVTALYYFSFNENIQEVMSRFPTFFYGSLKATLKDNNALSPHIANRWLYCGTFYWGNYQLISQIMKNTRKEPPFTSRWYDEFFPGNICEEMHGFTYHQRFVIGEPVFETTIDSWLQYAYNYDGSTDYKDFIDFYNKIKEEQ